MNDSKKDYLIATGVALVLPDMIATLLGVQNITTLIATQSIAIFGYLYFAVMFYLGWKDPKKYPVSIFGKGSNKYLFLSFAAGTFLALITLYGLIRLQQEHRPPNHESLSVTVNPPHSLEVPYHWDG